MKFGSFALIWCEVENYQSLIQHSDVDFQKIELRRIDLECVKSWNHKL